MRYQPTQPLVSVIVPVRNEEYYITRCLEAICEQEYPHLEILVVDGASDDATVSLVQQMQTLDPRIQLLHNPKRRQVFAMNIGIDAAKGAIIVRVDGHAVIAKDYIRAAVEHLWDNDRVAAVGGLQYAVGTTSMGRAIAAATNSAVAHPSPHRIAQQNKFVDAVWMGAWRRETLDAVGTWNEQLPINEDYEYSYRIRQQGGKLLLSMDMQATYYCRETLRALWRQYFAYGRGKVMMLHEHPESVLVRHMVAPTFVAALLGGATLSRIRVIRWLWLLMLGAYSLLIGGQSLRLANGDAGLGWRLIFVFVTIHVAWGLGFWVELLLPTGMDAG